VDVIIATRGGGSAEDLWAFNEEIVARAISASPVPVISAVGHEVDFTIADFVADVRAPTPSAAAEMVVAAKDEFCGRIDRLVHRLHSAVRTGLQRRAAAVHALTSRRGLAGWQARLAMKGRHAAELTHRLRRLAAQLVARRERTYLALRTRLEARDLRRHLATIRGRLEAAEGRLTSAVRRTQDQAGARVTALTGRLDSLSPLAVLARGYAVCWNDDRSAIVRTASAVAAGDTVRVTLHDGELRCEVKP
jgi:exodeoxyribonuclease VII large subunit